MKALLWVVVSLVPYLEGKIVVPPWHPDIPFNLKRGNAYPNHPDINYLTNEFTPQGHLSVQNAIRDGQTLPGGHPSLYSFVDHQQPNLDVPRATLPYYHPDITEAYQAAYPLPAGHQLVHDLFKSDIPSNHPNIDDLLRNPRALPFPAWHPDITPYVLHLGPTVLYQLPHWHPDVDYSLSKAFQTPPGHQPVHDILSSLMPADHRNVDDLLAAGTPLPVYHPRVNPLVGQSRDHYATFGCVAMIPSFHPNLEEAYTKNQHVPGNHPKIHDYYKDLLPPNHQNIDDLLATTAADRIPFPAFHPPINRFVAKKPTLSAGILLGIFLVAIVGFLALVRYGQRLQKYVSGTNRGKNKFHDVAMELIPTNETAKEEPPTEKEELTPKKLAENEQQNLAQFEIVESNDLYARRDSRAIFVRPSVDETPAVQLADDDAPKTTPLSSHRSRSMSRSGSVVEGQLHRRSLRMRQASVSQMIRRGEPLYDFPATDPTKPLPPPRAAPYTGELTEKAMQRAELSVLMLRRVPYTDLTIGSVSLMLLYLLLNIIAGVLTNKTPGCLQNPGQEKILGRVFGSLTASNSMVLVILATHNSVLTWILGIPFDHVIVYHRFVGRVVLVLGLIHFLLMLGSQSHSMVIYTGVGALACGGVIGLTTFNWVRRRFFSVFYWAHYSFVGYYVLGFIHVPECRPFLAIGAGFYFLDKLLRALWTLLPRKTLEFVNVGDDLARVRFPKNPLTDMLGLHKVGQYYFVNFPRLSLTEWHPFSVSSGPLETGVQLHIRALGNHTRKIVKHAQDCAKEGKQTPIRTDGPYGNQNFNYRRYPVLVLCGGGVGITPVMSIIKDIYNVGNYTTDRERLVRYHCIQTVYATWVVQKAADATWFLRDLWNCMKRAEQVKHMPKLVVWIYVSKEQKAPAPLIPGRPNFNQLFMSVRKAHSQKAALCFACGPSGMIHELWDLSSKHSRESGRMDFHHEIFEF